jgi:Glutathione S-transferase, N-terminal domain
MGLLVDGVWQDQWYDTRSTDGRFVRAQSGYRNWITADGAPGPSGQGGFSAAAGRYHLYVSLACPWAHRTLIFRKLKRLEHAVSVSVVEPLMLADGWVFGPPGSATADGVNGKAKLADVYLAADAKFTGRVTVPVLWDRERGTIVNNESSEIIRMFNSAFDAVTDDRTDYYPAPLRDAIDAINATIYGNVNNGVYRTGFATRLRGSLSSAVRDAGRPGAEARAKPLPGRRSRDRGRLAAVHHARPLRCRLCRPLQVQSAANRRLSQPVELFARSLPGPGRRLDRRHGSHQAPLLRQPSPDQSHRHRTARSGARLHGAPRSRTSSGGLIVTTAPTPAPPS